MKETHEEMLNRVGELLAHGDNAVVASLTDDRLPNLFKGLVDNASEFYPFQGLENPDVERPDDDEYNMNLWMHRNTIIALDFACAVILAHCPKNVVDTLVDFHRPL